MLVNMKVNVLYHNEDTERLHKVGMEIDEEEFDIEEITVFEVSSVEKNRDNPNYSILNCAGIQYSVAMPYEEILKEVNRNYCPTSVYNLPYQD